MTHHAPLLCAHLVRALGSIPNHNGKRAHTPANVPPEPSELPPTKGCLHSVSCGRPFLVQGEARVATASGEPNWQLPLPVVMFPRDERLRELLVEHYATAGLMEHASIAAFARFGLQLLSLGAPAEFIEASNQAQVDETRHARLCFALSSVYAGSPLSPGPLPVQHALDDCSWEGVFSATVLEGCIGETRAALEAIWAAERCVDPVVRDVLKSISDDETRHAGLAWQAAKWMLGERPELKRLIPRLFGSTERTRTSRDERPLGARSWGVLNDTELTACWYDAWAEIITPCARSLVRTNPLTVEQSSGQTRRSA